LGELTVKVRGIDFSYGSEKALKNINMEADAGEITGIIGPNAAGKSTLLKCIAGMLNLDQGSITINGGKVRELDKDRLSKRVSFLPQDTSTRAVLPVIEAVLIGKVHSLSWNVKNREVEEAWKMLEKLGIDNLAERHLNELSGGQKQMVNIAQSLVRKPNVFLLDEPTTNLDLQHQLEVLDLIKIMTIEEKIATIVSSHDLNQVTRYADKLVVLNGGSVYTTGEPESVLTTDMMKTVYRVNSRIDNGAGNIPRVIPISSTEKEKEMKRKIEDLKSKSEDIEG